MLIPVDLHCSEHIWVILFILIHTMNQYLTITFVLKAKLIHTDHVMLPETQTLCLAKLSL